MTTYRFVTTNILSGKIAGDWLPLIPQNCARTINAIGTFTGALPLLAGRTPAERRAYLAAVEPEKSLLWIFQDTVPAWAGIIWDQPHMSILDNTLPLTASTPESLFQKRQISDDLTFTDVDLFDVFRGLAQYALSKGTNSQLAGFTMGTNTSGVIISISYAGTDKKLIYDAWTDLVTAYGFEYSIRPGVDQSGNYYLSLDLGYPTLGLPLDGSGLAFSLPGNLSDYRFTRTGSTSANTIVATASASGTLSAINANSDFETGVTPWVAINGATLTTATDWSGSGSQSAAFNGNGSTSNPAMQSEADPVTGGGAYTLSAALNSVAGWPSVQLTIQWLDGTGTLISAVSCAAVAVTSSTPTTASLSASAPQNAVSARSLVQMTGKPASSVIMEADDVILTTATPSSGNWESALPHGQDTAALAAGYPLLETSASLSTVTVTQQAQIDAYANGLLPSMSGTQLAPLLTLAGGQSPAVSSIVLGSYCQFTATSPLHPANDDGSPGLQVNARVIGWTLYPPSSSQTEYSWIQLGAIEDLDGKTYVPFTGAV
jgi:hypothetical protein